jgi:hypothetical protein
MRPSLLRPAQSAYKVSMRPLRNLSARPELLVDQDGNRVADPVSNTVVGVAGPFGRERVVNALPLNNSMTGPVQLAPHLVLHGVDGFYICDPGGSLLGEPAIWVHRMLDARWTQDTRRLT